MATNNTSPARWPTSIANLKAFKPGDRDVPVTIPVLEFPLFTDALVIEEANLGPYAFLNTEDFRGDIVRTAIVLRYAACDYEAHREQRTYDKSRTELYHGGYAQDELAALASLILGIRLSAGSVSREFKLKGDPLGRPTELGSRDKPFFRTPRNYVIPSTASGQHNLQDLQRIEELKDVSQKKAVAIIRSARIRLVQISILSIANSDSIPRTGQSVVGSRDRWEHRKTPFPASFLGSEGGNQRRGVIWTAPEGRPGTWFRGRKQAPIESMA